MKSVNFSYECDVLWTIAGYVLRLQIDARDAFESNFVIRSIFFLSFFLNTDMNECEWNDIICVRIVRRGWRWWRRSREEDIEIKKYVIFDWTCRYWVDIQSVPMCAFVRIYIFILHCGLWKLDRYVFLSLNLFIFILCRRSGTDIINWHIGQYLRWFYLNVTESLSSRK